MPTEKAMRTARKYYCEADNSKWAGVVGLAQLLDAHTADAVQEAVGEYQGRIDRMFDALKSMYQPKDNDKGWISGQNAIIEAMFLRFHPDMDKPLKETVK